MTTITTLLRLAARAPRLILALVLCLGLQDALAAASAPEGDTAATQAARIQDLLDGFAQHGIGSHLEALKRLKEIGDPDPALPLQVRGMYYASLAQEAQATGDDQSMELAMARLQRMADQEHCAACNLQLLIQKMRQALGRGSTKDMRDLYAQMQALPKSDSLDDQLSVLLTKAQALEAMSDTNAALGDALEAGDIAARHGTPADKVFALDLLARINGRRRDMKRALQYTDEAYALSEQIGNVYLMVSQRINQSYYYATLKDRPRQFAALRHALQLSNSAPDMESARLVCLNNLANYYNGAPNGFAQAYDYAMRAERLAQQLDDEVLVAFARTNRGVAMVHLGQVDSGIALAIEGVATVRRLGLELETADLLEQLAIAYETAGRPQQALAAAREQLAINTRLAQSESDKSIQELQERFSAERKVLEIQQLQLQYERDHAEVAARASQLKLWVVAALALLLGLLLLGLRLRRARSRHASLAMDNARLSEQVSRDGLTGAFNRRHCECLMAQQQLAMGRSRDRHYAAKVGLMLVDVDHFKQINDTHGHAAGDEVLKEVSRRLQASLRERDAVVRWGGEEFLLVLPGTPAERLDIVAQRILAALGGTPIEVAAGVALTVTASAGAVAWPAFEQQSWEDAVHMSDLALYMSKRSGRNRATCLQSIADDAMDDSERGNRLRSDLAAARDAGDVSLQTVDGPQRQAVSEAEMPAA